MNNIFLILFVILMPITASIDSLACTSSYAIDANYEKSNGFLVLVNDKVSNSISITLEDSTFSGAWDAGKVNLTVNEKHYEFSYFDGKTIEELALDMIKKLESDGFKLSLSIYKSPQEVVVNWDEEDGPISGVVYQGPVWKAVIILK